MYPTRLKTFDSELFIIIAINTCLYENNFDFHDDVICKVTINGIICL